MSQILKGKKIVLGVSGGIAAYKSVYLLRLLKKAGAEVQIIGTANAKYFVGDATWEALSGKAPQYDTFATPDASKISHIMLGQEVDLIIVAPATANIIAKAACGIADDLLSTVLLSATAPVIFAPGMNCEMYAHPATQKNFEILQNRSNIYFIDSNTGELACNTSGKGRMAEPEEIFRYSEYVLAPKTLAGQRWLISCGATREYLDPIRFITNGSSGKMGAAIAKIAADSGADVTLISANISSHLIAALPQVKHISVVSAADMCAAVTEQVATADVFVMSAAVADYTIARSISKLKKQDGDMSLTLQRTKDILIETISLSKPDQLRIGFAAESDHLIEHALDKLARKKLDMIVANLVAPDFNPFGSDENIIHLITADTRKNLAKMNKSDAAKEIVEEILHIMMRKKHG